MTRYDLPDLLYKVIKSLGGGAPTINIFRRFWHTYESDLKKSGDLFYTWNYDIRWAATELRKQGRMLDASQSPKGVWEII